MRLKKALDNLKKNDGVTMVFALVVFMIAAIMSATIVNVALNNMSRVKSQRTSEQARLAVMSAVDYLQSNEESLNKELYALFEKADDGDEEEDDIDEISAPNMDEIIWTIYADSGVASEISDALSTNIKWTRIVEDTLLEATVSSNGSDPYAVKVTLVYTAEDGKWSVKKIAKVDE